MTSYLLCRCDGFYWDGLHGWTAKEAAAITADREEAELMCSDWNSWFVTKGYPYRVFLHSVTECLA